MNKSTFILLTCNGAKNVSVLSPLEMQHTFTADERDTLAAGRTLKTREHGVTAVDLLAFHARMSARAEAMGAAE